MGGYGGHMMGPGYGGQMNKANPDKGKLGQLQKEISALRSDFDEKALAHQLEVRKLLPEDYRGGGYGHGRGYCW